MATIGPCGSLLAASTIAYASAAAKPDSMNERWRCGAKSDEAAVSSERVISGCSSQTAITTAARRSRRASITTPASATAAGTNQNSATVVPNQVSPSARHRLLENGSITLPPWPTSYLSCSGLYTWRSASSAAAPSTSATPVATSGRFGPLRSRSSGHSPSTASRISSENRANRPNGWEPASSRTETPQATAHRNCRVRSRISISHRLRKLAESIAV